MKKFYTLITLVFFVYFSQNAHAQSCGGTPFLSENFENGIPGSWTVLDLDANPLWWSMYTKGFTGAWQPFVHDGRKCAAVCDYFDGGTWTADDYLITPAITLGPGPICLSWKASAVYDGYINSYSILISTTGTNPSDFLANPPLFDQPQEIAFWTDYSIDISAYAGQTVYIAFYDYTSGGYAIYIDDVKITHPVSLDVSATSVDLNDVVLTGSYPVSGRIYNAGTSTVNSVNVNWQVDNGPINGTNITSLNILPGSYFDFIHNTNWSPSSNGTYTFKVWASTVNGQPDQYTGNDMFSKTVFVNNFSRKVFLEEFTQASCPPCADQNPYYDSLIYENRITGKVTAVKYHTVWPGYDPMNILNPTQVVERVMYYGVVGVPSAFLNGSLNEPCFDTIFGGMWYQGAPACLSQERIDSAYAIPTIFQIQVNGMNYGSNANVNVTVTAKTDFPLTTFTLYTVVIEDTIDYGTPPGTNGESLFPQVMRSMLPDYSGQPLPTLNNNQSVSYNFQFPVLPDYNTDQLKIVCFIQDEVTKKVYQSEMTENALPLGVDDNVSVDDHIFIYPTPAKDIITLRITGREVQSLQVMLNSITGQEVKSENITITPGFFEKTFDVKNLANGVYYFRLISENTVSMKRFVKE